MGSRQKAEREPAAASRLYLITPPADDHGGLAAALATMPLRQVAAVLLRLPEADERSLVNTVKRLGPAVQEHGCALLLDRPELVARAGADGAHLAGVPALQAALAQLKPERIAGVGALPTRHDAMLAGEAGADYVMFGDAEHGGLPSPLAALLGRIQWWSEIFEIPCVGVAADTQQIAPLAQAGADFVAVGDFIWSDERGPAVALAAAAERLNAVEPV